MKVYIGRMLYGDPSDPDEIRLSVAEAIRRILAHPDLVAALEAAQLFITPYVQDEESEGREGAACLLNDRVAAALVKARGQ